jgi:anti-sigma-K factor RskA
VSSRDHDLSGYLLGELSAPEREAFERALADDPELRREVERLRPVTGRLAALDPAAWTPVEPPPLRMPATAPARPASPQRRRRPALVLRPAVAFAAAAVLLLAGVGGGLLLAGDDDPPAGAARPLAAVGADRVARGKVRMTAAGAELQVSGLRPTRGGGYYELWLLNSRDDLVALGSFRVPASGKADVSVPMPTDPSRFRYLDVSAEPADGDPAHSGRSVLRASLG